MPPKPQVHLFVKNSLVETEAPKENPKQLLKQQEETLKRQQAIELKELEQKHKEDIQTLKKSQEKDTDAPASSDSEELSDTNEYDMEDGWLVKDEEVDATLFSLQEIKATPSAVLKTIRVGTLMEAISFDDDDQAYDWFNCIVTSAYRPNKGVQICFVDETNQPKGKKEWTTRIKVRDDLVKVRDDLVEIDTRKLSEQLLIEQRHVDNLLDEVASFKKCIKTYKRKLKTEHSRAQKYKKKWITVKKQNELEM